MLRMIPKRGVGAPAPPITIPGGASATPAKYSSRRSRVTSIVGDLKLNPRIVLKPLLPRSGTLSGLLLGYQTGGRGAWRVGIGVSGRSASAPAPYVTPLSRVRITESKTSLYRC